MEKKMKTAKAANLPRGMRNNNPLNMVYSKKNNWHGQLPYNKVIESRFCRFSEPMWGFRAAACLLRKYINIYGCDTIEKIISRWAPSVENDTRGYINYVSNSVGIPCDTKISFKNMTVMLRLMSAMCCQENGKEYDPQNNNDLWAALYKGYMMARDNVTDFSKIDDTYEV